MHINNSAVSFTSLHQFERNESYTQRVQERVATSAPSENANRRSPASSASTVDVSASKKAQHINNEPYHDNMEKLLATLDVTTLLLKALVEMMTGKKIEDYHFSQEVLATNDIEPLANTPAEVAAPALNIETLIYTSASIYEYEYSAVNISAELNNADGSSLSLSMNVVMERRYEASFSELTVRQGKLTDPLVINFNGDTVKLAAKKTAFDIDSDGNNEQIASLTSNSAYLALDRNNDGVINNGSELFGPLSGNGFAELASFDEDANGFIDERDSIYSQLQAYRPSDNYQVSLSSLQLGAIYTNAVNSPFTLTDDNNAVLGKVRSTGFYLSNDGQMGSVQQIDLAV